MSIGISVDRRRGRDRRAEQQDDPAEQDQYSRTCRVPDFRRPISIGVATKLRYLCLCKVEMSLGGIAGSVSRRRGDDHIGAAPASAESFRLRFGVCVPKT
jgi:hypothetical protein